ncbi:MAG: type II toxin-antitoxin system RelE/ParE family toxin [Nanoarchaeota archaeon]
MYEIFLDYPAQRFIKTLSEEKKKKVLDAIEVLSPNPYLGKNLVGRLSGLRSLRTDNYRIIYKIEDVKLLVLVLRIGYRGDIYSRKIGK